MLDGRPTGGMAKLEHPSVLIADDDRSITEGLSAILRDEGYDVAVAVDGQKALDQLGIAHDLFPRWSGPKKT